MGNPYAPPGESSRRPETDGGPAGRPAEPGPAHGPSDPHTGRPGGPDLARGLGALPPDGLDGPGGPPRPAADSPVVRATARRVVHFFALLLAALATMSLPLPWQVGSLVFVLAAMVVGARAFALAWRGGIRGGLLLALGTGVAMAGVLALLMTTLLAVWPEQMARQQCLARAVTIAATQDCENEFQRALDERLGRPGDPTP